MNQEKFLIDKFGRRINYLRVSITPNCNFRCIYCARENISLPEHPIEEYLKIIKVATSLGITQLRITGGEPFLRTDIMDFLLELSKLNLKIGITTNASLIHEKHIDTLAKLNIKKFNISLDTLNKKKFKQITGKDSLETVLENIKMLKTISKEVKINTVVLNNVNIEDIVPLIHFALQQDLVLRFIEYMPIGKDKKFYYSTDNIIEKIRKDFGNKLKEFHDDNLGFGPGKYFELQISTTSRVIIGVISAISHPFCSSCNRLRITSNLTLRNCLGHNTELKFKDLNNPQEIKKLLFSAIELKPQQYNFTVTNKDCMRIIGG